MNRKHLACRLELYKCELNDEDFRDGKSKLCGDEIYKRRLYFTARVQCSHFSRTLKVMVMSLDGRR
jgi:hypothetical protein